MTPLIWPDAISAAAQGSDVELTVTQLTRMNWFTSPETNKLAAETSIHNFLSKLGIGKLPIRWLGKQEIAPFLRSYELIKDPIWAQIYDIPQSIKDAADAKGGKEILSFTMNDVPEYLFHVIYDAAFHAFERQGEQVISHIVAAALYIASLSAAWDSVCDENNPLSELLEVLKLGYLPLGVKDGAFYMH